MQMSLGEKAMFRKLAGLSAAIVISGCVSAPPEQMNVVERVKTTNLAIYTGQCAGSFEIITDSLELAGDKRAHLTASYADEMSAASRADFDKLFNYPEFAAKHYETNLAIGMRQVQDKLREGQSLDDIMYVMGTRCEVETGLAVRDYGLNIDALG
jgi:hypothetical protein